MGTQIHRGPSELLTQKSDDRPKNGTLNKRVRTSVAETRSEYRSNGLLRQPVLMTKEREICIRIIMQIPIWLKIRNAWCCWC
nr:uncharacterized protein LOC109148070 [Ipomoea batatas]